MTRNSLVLACLLLDAAMPYGLSQQISHAQGRESVVFGKTIDGVVHWQAGNIPFQGSFTRVSPLSWIDTPKACRWFVGVRPEEVTAKLVSRRDALLSSLSEKEHAALK